MRSRLIVLVCLTVGTSTVPIGVFPALLPDLDRVVGLSDIELGALAAAFGFARMVMDVPVGLFVARHLAIALAVSPVLLALGVATIATGGSFAVLLAGRLLMGVAHALGMVAWLTTILRWQAGATMARSLNAMEFTAMIGMLLGTAAVGLLPRDWSWNVVLAVACLPQLIGIALGLLMARAVPDAEATPVTTSAPPAPMTHASGTVALAFTIGTVLAIAYSMLEGYQLPLRGARDFALDRTGVAALLIVAQLVDLAALMPVGLLADRTGVPRLLAAIIVTAMLATALVGFGGFTAAVGGAACLGLAMAGWMLPVALLRQGTPPAKVAWRTALYRVGVDAGLFLGPFLAGVMGPHTWLLSSGIIATLAVLGVLLLRLARNPA